MFKLAGKKIFTILRSTVFFNLYLELFLIYPVSYIYRPPDKSVTGKLFSYFSTKTYVVGAQKNCLNETVLLGSFEHPKHMFKLMGKQIMQF